jgi:phosphate starvation-inducible PhoH-like protein
MKDVIATTVRGKRITPQSPNQRGYVDAIRNHDLVFATGIAGVGKSFLAVAMGVAALRDRKVARLILTRPAVEAGERLGFLPGDLQEKIDPYLRPLYDALYELMPQERFTRAMERGEIEVAPLGYMRGRTLNEAFIILDEAQNTTPQQMKMFLTRLGYASQAVVTGDVTQIDLERGQQSGLVAAREILRDVQGVSFVDFDEKDVVRHELVARIVRAYDRHEKNNQ